MTTLSLRTAEIIIKEGVKLQNWSRDPDHAHSGVILYINFAAILPRKVCVKFQYSDVNGCGKIKGGGVKLQIWSRIALVTPLVSESRKIPMLNIFDRKRIQRKIAIQGHSGSSSLMHNIA